MKPVNVGLLFAVVLTLLFIFETRAIHSFERDIQHWSKVHGEVAKKIELRTWSCGPYIPMKGYHYFRVETETNVYWFEYGWTPTVEKEVNGGYQKVE